MLDEKLEDIEEWLSGPITKEFFRCVDKRADGLASKRPFYPGNPDKTHEVFSTLNGGIEELRFIASLVDRDPEDIQEVFNEE